MTKFTVANGHLEVVCLQIELRLMIHAEDAREAAGEAEGEAEGEDAEDASIGQFNEFAFSC